MISRSCSRLILPVSVTTNHIFNLAPSYLSYRRLYSTQDDIEDQENSIPDGSKLTSTRGKKLKPTKAKIVVLSPKQAGLFKKKRTPGYFKQNEKRNERLTVLEGVELGKTVSNSTNSSDILQQIENQRRKLLVFKGPVPKEQVIQSIHDLRPTGTQVSSKRYEQLKSLLESAYTLPQLRDYVAQYYKTSVVKSAPKKVLIPRIMNRLWGCQIDESISEAEDLIVERIIDLETKDIYLLLLTNNGKILYNFARVGATLAVVLNENKIIVRATSAMVKYVEVSLRKILSNMQSEVLPVRDIISNHTSLNSDATLTPEEVISLVQKESAAYFEEMLDEDGTYTLTAFGDKRVNHAKNLLLWAMNYNPQRVEEHVFCGNEERSSYKLYPFTNIECLDWLESAKEWYRLQRPVSKKTIKDFDQKINKVEMSDKKVDELYNFFTKENRNDIAIINSLGDSKVLSITLGQVLITATNKESIFQPKIPQITPRLLALPLYDGMATKDELYTVDQHEYYIQLKFIPDLSTTNSGKNIPPLELWFELDDYDKAITSSVRAVVHLEERNVYLQTPQLSHDFKINMDRIGELVRPYEENPENWLQDQPGLKEFLIKSNLTFQGRKKLVIPKKLVMNLNVEGSDTPEQISFDYVNVKYRRVLKLKYMDKYLVQFTDVNGGSGGGRYTQVDFVNGEDMCRETLVNFIKDATQFL